MRWWIVLLLLPAAVWGRENPDSLFQEGNRAYREGRYADAIARYEEIRSLGFESGPLFYNLGNAYFKVEDLGRSVAGYLRALRTMPRDGDLRENLAYVRGRTLDRTMVSERLPLVRLAIELCRYLTWKEWLALSEAAYGVTLLLAGVFLFRPTLRGRLRSPLEVCAICLLAVGLFLGRSLYEHEHLRRGAILPGEVTVRSGPGDRFTEEFLLHQGTVVRLGREAEGWISIDLSADLRGWLPAGTVEEI